MGPLWRLLAALLVCTAAQDPAEIEAELGRDLTLNCSLDSSIIYWYTEIHSQVKGCIAKVIDTEVQYWVETSTSKYEATLNRLVIRNVSAEDCRLYFCGRKNNSRIHFEETFRVVSNASVAPPPTDLHANCTQPEPVGGWRNDVIMFGSFALNAIAALTGVVFICLRLRRSRSRESEEEEPSTLTYENAEMQESPQYEEIQLSPCTSSPAEPPSECIYHKAQLPQPVPP